MKTIYYLKNILIPIYLPGSTNLGRVVYAKEIGLNLSQINSYAIDF